MKLNEFLKLCKDTDIGIMVGKTEIDGTEYRHIYPYLDYEIEHFETLGYDKIFVTLKEQCNGRND